MDPDKPPGPEGFNAYFFQPCWDIVKEDFVDTPKDCSWGYIIRIRDDVMDAIRYQIGDGTSVSFWHHPWLTNGPLSRRIDYSVRVISRIPKRSQAGSKGTGPGPKENND
ncbi:conserved hypothetical protein [Ricinus communis]|uniref:Uncharacterized protein n=1 Tax=Ricinus communis TaxID=3988 RepID=B9TBS8_RICCO|nr:conserved hypothetical protein [Ricinus communis]